MNKKILLYTDQNGNVSLDVSLENETVRLNQKQMVELFGRDKSVISRHIKNIFNNKELDENSTVAKNATVQMEGNREVIREVEYYNLDMIISLGYRVNSKSATQFRIWATKTLKEYLVKGYVINQKTVQESQLNELTATINLIKNFIENKELRSDGNKRIGSFVFILFLSENDLLYKANGELRINDNALVSLALLIATSEPQEKELMVKLVVNLLGE